MKLLHATYASTQCRLPLHIMQIRKPDCLANAHSQACYALVHCSTAGAAPLSAALSFVYCPGCLSKATQAVMLTTKARLAADPCLSSGAVHHQHSQQRQHESWAKLLKHRYGAQGRCGRRIGVAQNSTAGSSTQELPVIWTLPDSPVSLQPKA